LFEQTEEYGGFELAREMLMFNLADKNKKRRQYEFIFSSCHKKPPHHTTTTNKNTTTINQPQNIDNQFQRQPNWVNTFHIFSENEQ